MREMMFATWAGRLAFLVFLVAGALGWLIGGPFMALVIAAAAVFLFTLGAYWLMDATEPTEQKLARLAARRDRESGRRRGRRGRAKTNVVVAEPVVMAPPVKVGTPGVILDLPKSPRRR